MPTLRNLAEAREVIWSRIRVTILNDLDIGEWMLDDFEEDEKSVELLTKATKEIASSIDKRLERHAKRLRLQTQERTKWENPKRV